MTSLVGPRKAKTEDILNTGKDAQRGNLSRAHVMLQMWVCDEQAFPPVYVQPCCSAREKPGPEQKEMRRHGKAGLHCRHVREDMQACRCKQVSLEGVRSDVSNLVSELRR